MVRTAAGLVWYRRTIRLTGRIRMLERAALSAEKQVFVDNLQFDVERDVAYSGENKKEAEDRTQDE